MASGGKKIAHAMGAPPGSPKYLVHAFEDVGVVEYVVRQRKRVSNPVVVNMAVTVLGYKVDTIKTPWCAIWIGAKLEDEGYTCTKSAMARSYLKWGTAVDHGDDSKWRAGDICVIWRGKHNDGVTGHVFFLLEWDDETVTGLGGNQGDTVSVQEFPRSKIIGLRRPRTVLASKVVQSSLVAAGTKAVEVVGDKALPSPAEVEKVVETARGPIEILGAAKPWILSVLATVSILATMYAIWYRMRDFNSGRNA